MLVRRGWNGFKLSCGFGIAVKNIHAHHGGNERKLAVVTGGCRGIGRAIAVALSVAGCRVVINYSKSDELAQETVNDINERMMHDDVAIAIKADCSDSGAVKEMFSKIKKDFGAVDILVNNAGIVRDKLAQRMTPQDFSDVVCVNLNGVFYCSQAVYLTSMMRKKEGRIVNISSVVGQMGNIGQANYAASKGGVLSLTRSLAKEFAARNICVNAVCPGFIDSEMTSALDSEAIIQSIPLKRFGTVDEVAGLVKFLALDPAGAYITGHIFNIDGGVAIGAT